MHNLSHSAEKIAIYADSLPRILVFKPSSSYPFILLVDGEREVVERSLEFVCK